MAIIVPEIVLFNVVEGLLKHVKQDIADNAADETNSFLYRILQGVKDRKHDYYVEAKNLFSREEDNPRAIRTRMFFDAQEANIPTVHITMPQEQYAQNENSIGVGEDPKDTWYNSATNEITPSRERHFDTTFHVIITSDNHREVLIIYHVVKSLMIAALSEINLMGLEDPKLGGQDIRPKEDIVPPHIFMRGVSVNVSYDVTVPRFFPEELIRQLIITGVPVDPSQPTNGIQSQVTLDDDNN